ncbi:glycosyl transferase [Caenimonas aquaedulcis]|uniref:Glycosyl transferase n=1 Tax=Caenimonas aquaedulcis TaxID=2793270 RepID=A0A931H6Y5_9BURK|nr:glycosyl transferase [Caenimonas aquaedulcis]MBG9389811.1 glycosyl transferase [Caenimonas aquaedulcis]
MSHGHGPMVTFLVHRLCEVHGGWIEHVVVTHNIDGEPLQPPVGGWPFRVTEVFNAQPAGFGANHNRAFQHCSSDFYCVLNPDVELPGSAIWKALVDQAGRPNAGLSYPTLLNPDGTRQDNEREAVTPVALLRRHLLRRPQRRVDWVSAAFWLVPSAVYRQMGGFDERFFMYCEDTDFCLRLRLDGLAIRRADAAVVHQAMRRSRLPGKQFFWHLYSLFRLWSGQVLWRYVTAAAS